MALSGSREALLSSCSLGAAWLALGRAEEASQHPDPEGCPSPVSPALQLCVRATIGWELHPSSGHGPWELVATGF